MHREVSYFCRMSYPILDVLDEVKNALANHNVAILQAPPGAGKSTILPLELLREPWLTEKKIIMLEPRRLATKSVAQRMASLRNENVGDVVGYRIRFDTKVGRETRIEVVTEGILTRMLQQDASLEDVGLVILDEFHERSLHADLALALCLQSQQLLRSDLRILIMSATLESQQLSTALGGVPIITSSGRQFPVAIQYSKEKDDIPVTTRTAGTIRKALRENDGDVLVFLPGAGEINRVQAILEDEQPDAIVYPLFGDLSFQKQQEAILPDPRGRRKIVLATSIAETSLTIEGVSIVVDCGLARVPRFDPRSGLTRLETIRVTRDAADQRAGRAGRLGPGVCYRLWSEGVQGSLVASRKPEILEADLSSLMLELAQWGVVNVADLMWVTAPPVGAVAQARDLLEQLGAIDDGRITARGKEMLRLPTHPRIAHLLIEAKTSALGLATDVAALLEERDPLAKESGADMGLRIDALRKWRGGERVSADRNSLDRIEKVASQWRRILKVEQENRIPREGEVGILLFAAYPERLAQQLEPHSERYKLANGRVVKLPPHDALTREPWLCVAHLDAGSGEGKIFLAASIEPKEVMSLAKETEVIRWDEERNMVAAAVEKRIGPLVLERRSLAKFDEQKKNSVLCALIRERGLKFIGWGEAQQEWQARVMSLRSWRPEEPWPEVSDEKLLETLEDWLAPFLGPVTKLFELQRLNWDEVLPTILPWALSSQLDRLAPVRISVPTGSMIKVNYSIHGDPPVVEVRLQEMFGLFETPQINEGRTRVILHLLSPGYKPVQVTQDLRSFWQTTYHDVRKELRMRYPKHHWPEDPLTAEPVRGVKRRN
jgi:ATP-dependent helicase HrpB